MRRGPVTLVAGAVAAVAVVPALAVQPATITASDTVFTPAELTVATGETVGFANAGGTHNFAFEDGNEYPPSPTPAGDPAWDGLGRTFTAPGDHRFRCEAHPSMLGVIHVRDPAPTPSPTPTPTPTPAPGQDAEVEVRRLALAASSFCTRRGPRCARPGVRVRIDLTRAARVTGTLRRRARAFGRVRFGTVAAGPRTLSFRRTATGRRLSAGRYALRLRVAGAAQPVLRFKVR